MKIKEAPIAAINERLKELLAHCTHGRALSKRLTIHNASIVLDVLNSVGVNYASMEYDECLSFIKFTASIPDDGKTTIMAYQIDSDGFDWEVV